MFFGRMTKEKEEKKKNPKIWVQPGASSLNIEFNSDGGACQKVTSNFEERPSLAKKFVQWLPSRSTCWIFFFFRNMLI
jgi:hypothetical protein